MPMCKDCRKTSGLSRKTECACSCDETMTEMIGGTGTKGAKRRVLLDTATMVCRRCHHLVAAFVT